jgi:hypothetical protein
MPKSLPQWPLHPHHQHPLWVLPGKQPFPHAEGIRGLFGNQTGVSGLSPVLVWVCLPPYELNSRSFSKHVSFIHLLMNKFRQQFILSTYYMPGPVYHSKYRQGTGLLKWLTDHTNRHNREPNEAVHLVSLRAPDTNPEGVLRWEAPAG